MLFLSMIFMTSPEVILSTKSSDPPICTPAIKIMGTPDYPVMSYNVLWIAPPLGMSSTFIT